MEVVEVHFCRRTTERVKDVVDDDDGSNANYADEHSRVHKWGDVDDDDENVISLLWRCRHFSMTVVVFPGKDAAVKFSVAFLRFFFVKPALVS